VICGADELDWVVLCWVVGGGLVLLMGLLVVVSTGTGDSPAMQLWKAS